MAVLTRAQILAKINLWITTNGNKDITGAQLNEILTDMTDSGFILPSDNAFDVNYTPTTPADWGATVPTETGGALDILIQKVLSNASPTIAYVATTGSDVVNEFEIGNPLKPFATIKAAWEGTPSSNVIIKVLGGSFTEADLDIIGTAKTNFVVDLSGITLNVTNANLRFRGSTNGVINCQGAEINSNVRFTTMTNIGLVGGKINGYIETADNCYLQNCTIESTIYATIGLATSVENRTIFSKCTIKSTGTGFNNSTIRTRGALYVSCRISTTDNYAVSPSSTSGAIYDKFIDCSIKGTGTSNALIFGENGILNGVFQGCRIEATAGQCIYVGNLNLQKSSNNILFDNCTIIATTTCVVLATNLERTATARTTFKKCSFFTDTGSGEIFTGNPAVGDLGKTQLIGTTLTNKALLVLNNFETLGDQITVTDAQIPPL